MGKVQDGNRKFLNLLPPSGIRCAAPSARQLQLQAARLTVITMCVISSVRKELVLHHAASFVNADAAAALTVRADPGHAYSHRRPLTQAAARRAVRARGGRGASCGVRHAHERHRMACGQVAGGLQSGGQQVPRCRGARRSATRAASAARPTSAQARSLTTATSSPPPTVGARTFCSLPAAEGS